VELVGLSPAQAQSKGIRVLKRLSATRYVAVLPAAARIEGLEVLGPLGPRWKLPARLLGLPSAEAHRFLLATPSPEALAKRLQGLGFAQAQALPQAGAVRLTLPLAQLENLLELPEIEGVSLESPRPSLESRVRGHNLVPNGIQALHHHYPALRGQGMLVSIQEPRYDTADIDLLGKHIPSGLEAEEMDLHSTDMGTIVAGRGNSGYSGRGAAPEASLSSSGYADALPDAADDYRRLGIMVQNHAYGTAPEAFYGVQAKAFDESASNNPELLHIFSAGNAGLLSSLEGTYRNLPGYANITGNFKMSKNALVVGAADSAGQAFPFSSAGPAYDGRLKPELVAYAPDGTSNAASLVSGTVALLQQGFDHFHGTPAPSALIKALLINSASEAGVPGPDYQTGYGSLNALGAMRALEAGQFWEDKVAEGEEISFELNIPENAKNLKITLVWLDPPAPAESGVALMNDLDLRLDNPLGVAFLPWVLRQEPDISLLALPAERGIDRLNNVEQVSLANPAAGRYAVRVKGHQLSGSTQYFVVAYAYDSGDDFAFVYPTASDFMPLDGETTTGIRWEHATGQALGSLQLRWVGEEDWQELGVVDLDKGQFYWEPPRLDARAQLRMCVAGGTICYESDTFRVSTPVPLSATLACGDSALLRWGGSPAVARYEVLALRGTSMQAIGNTADTALMVYPGQLGVRYFAVRPVAPEGFSWARSQVSDYTQQGAQCYVQAFSAVHEGASSARLSLLLTDAYRVMAVRLQRRTGTDWATIGELPGEGRAYEWLDEDPADGLNRYRALVVLSQGNAVPTDEAEVFVLRDSPYRVFPNPLEQGGALQVFSQEDPGEGAMVRFYDALGRLVVQEPWLSEREYLEPALGASGLYYYQLERQGKVVARGKLFVR
jgi:hypothetical protein